MIATFDRKPAPPRPPIEDYPVVITPLPHAEGAGYMASVPDLPGCISDGSTREEAARNVADAIVQWIEEARRLGRTIPRPTHFVAAALSE